jgi:hypothetical protein
MDPFLSPRPRMGRAGTARSLIMVTDIHTIEKLTAAGRGFIATESEGLVIRHRGISWGAVIGAATIALSIQAMLSLLGVGISAAVANPANTAQPLAPLGIGTLVWMCVSGLISFGIGGFIAGSMSSRWHSCGGAGHGLLVWSVAGGGGCCPHPPAPPGGGGGGGGGGGAMLGLAVGPASRAGIFGAIAMCCGAVGGLVGGSIGRAVRDKSRRLSEEAA